LFSRVIHSASTSIAKRSSKDSAITSGLRCCSCHAVAMAPSRIACNFSIVGSLNMSSPF